MANMRIYSQNYLNTTASIQSNVSDAGWTENAQYIFDRKNDKYCTFSANVSVGAYGFRLSFTSSIVFDLIIIRNVSFSNASSFYVAKDLSTVTSALSIILDTATAYWNTLPTGTSFIKLQSATSATVLFFNGAVLVTGTSAAISLSEVYIGLLQHEFTDNPAAGDYKPKFDRTEYKHKMSDGGTATYVIQDNFSADVKLKYVSSTDRNALKTIYQTQEPIVFIPFPTGTGWDGEIYEVNWVDDFDLGFTDNYTGNGYNIKMKLEETPK